MRRSDRVVPRKDHPQIWFTVGEVAYMLGVAVSALRMWVADGCVPSPRYCGRLEAFGKDWFDVWQRMGVCMPGTFAVEHLPISLPGVESFGLTTRERGRITKHPGRAAERGARKTKKGGAA